MRQRREGWKPPVLDRSRGLLIAQIWTFGIKSALKAVTHLPSNILDPPRRVQSGLHVCDSLPPACLSLTRQPVIRFSCRGQSLLLLLALGDPDLRHPRHFPLRLLPLIIRFPPVTSGQISKPTSILTFSTNAHHLNAEARQRAPRSLLRPDPRPNRHPNSQPMISWATTKHSVWSPNPTSPMSIRVPRSTSDWPGNIIDSQ